jgi:hypothetical protein
VSQSRDVPCVSEPSATACVRIGPLRPPILGLPMGNIGQHGRVQTYDLVKVRFVASLYNRPLEYENGCAEAEQDKGMEVGTPQSARGNADGYSPRQRIGAARFKDCEGTCEYKSRRNGNKSVLDGAVPRGSAQAIPEASGDVDHDRRGEEKRKRDDKRSEPSSRLPTDQCCQQRAWSGSRTRDGKRIDKLPLRYPALHHDCLVLHLGKHRRAAAD